MIRNRGLYITPGGLHLTAAGEGNAGQAKFSGMKVSRRGIRGGTHKKWGQELDREYADFRGGSWGAGRQIGRILKEAGREQEPGGRQRLRRFKRRQVGSMQVRRY
jgi:hypothetical protein